MNNDSEGDDLFVKHYFNNDGIQWYISDLTHVCNLCDDREVAEIEIQGSEQSEDEWQVEAIVVRRKCSNRSWKIKLPMDQLYLDLGASLNDNLSNKKRFVYYRWYKMFRHGVLLAKDSMRVCQCVEEEVSNMFPNLDGELRVRFCAIK